MTVFLVTGPSAAGKTTVARLLAEQFRRGVHLEGDFFRRSIVAGRHEMTPALEADALEQLRLRYRLPASAADSYVEAASSFHPGGVNMCMADGSVRFISEGINITLYRALSTIRGGECR